MVRLSHSRSGYKQGQETLLAPSSDKQTSNYDKKNTQTTIPPNQNKVLGLSCYKINL